MADGAMPIAEDDGYSVERLRRQYTEFAADKREELEEQRTHRHYYHGDQFTAAELAELKRRKQPVVTTPRLTKKINGIVGLLERMRQDPKAYPRTPQQEQGADLGTAIIRYAMDEADWKAISPEVCLNAAVNGLGGIELNIVRGDNGDPDVGMGTVDPETFFYDQRSVRPDFSDARFMGIAKWIDLDVAQEMFPDKANEIAALVSSGPGSNPMQSEQLSDRETRWVNSNEKQLFLVEQWYLKGSQWRWCFYSYNVELAKGQSPFRDEKGKSISRFVMFSANIDHDGDRYGFIRHLKSPTDETNSRRSKALHIMHTRRIIATAGAVDDIEIARREAARPDGYIVVHPGDQNKFEFDDVSKAADWQSQVALLEESKNELEGFGPNPELLGAQDSNKQSGRAIALLQQAGIAELGPFILAYRGWKLRVYRAVWNIIQTTWTAERYIRVTDDDNVAQFIRLNGLQIDPNTGHPTMVNALGSLDVDIILDEGPDTLNIMEDTGDALRALAQNGVPIPPQALIEVSSLPQATKKKLQDMLEQANQPNPLMVKEAEAKIEGEQAKAEETRSKTLKNMADAHLMVADAMRGDPAEAAPQQEMPKPPSISIAFKDLPPEAQSQALMEAGIFIPPGALAVHQAEMARQQVAMKAASRPQPQAA